MASLATQARVPPVITGTRSSRPLPRSYLASLASEAGACTAHASPSRLRKLILQASHATVQLGFPGVTAG